jgi:hypothetical protein
VRTSTPRGTRIASPPPAATPLEAKHAGSEIVAMRSTVGEAARWMVEERDGEALRKTRWRPIGEGARRREPSGEDDDLEEAG